MGYTIQGRPASVGLDPQVREGRTYVPLRELMSQIGGTASWDNDAKRATATIGQWVATVNMADTHVDVSGTPVTLQAPPFVDDQGVMWVPATFFRDAFGLNVDIAGDHVTLVNPSVPMA